MTSCDEFKSESKDEVMDLMSAVESGNENFGNVAPIGGSLEPLEEYSLKKSLPLLIGLGGQWL